MLCILFTLGDWYDYEAGKDKAISMGRFWSHFVLDDESSGCATGQLYAISPFIGSTKQAYDVS